MKFGIISTASIVPRFLNALNDLDICALAIASRNIDNANEIADKFNIERRYDSYQKIYEDDDIDIVYIATINSIHYQEIINALMHGKHVLCEKPMVLSIEEAIKVFELAKANDLFIMEMQKSVFLPVTLLVKEYINNKKLGKLLKVDLQSTFDMPEQSWMLDPTQGGVLIPSGSYTFEYIDFLLGLDKASISASGHTLENGTIDDININIDIDDIEIKSYITIRGKTSTYALFEFEKGYIKIEDYYKGNTAQINDGIETKYVVYDEFKHELVYEIAHVIECLNSGLKESPIMDHQRTLRCIEIVSRLNNGLKNE